MPLTIWPTVPAGGLVWEAAAAKMVLVGNDKLLQFQSSQLPSPKSNICKFLSGGPLKWSNNDGPEAKWETVEQF